MDETRKPTVLSPAIALGAHDEVVELALVLGVPFELAEGGRLELRRLVLQLVEHLRGEERWRGGGGESK